MGHPHAIADHQPQVIAPHRVRVMRDHLVRAAGEDHLDQLARQQLHHRAFGLGHTAPATT